MMGSHAYYINDQVDLARKQGAPQNAVHPKYDYPKPGGPQIGEEWTTIDDITNASTRHTLGLPPLTDTKEAPHT